MVQKGGGGVCREMLSRARVVMTFWESFGKNVVATGEKELSQLVADNDKQQSIQG